MPRNNTLSNFRRAGRANRWAFAPGAGAAGGVGVGCCAGAIATALKRSEEATNARRTDCTVNLRRKRFRPALERARPPVDALAIRVLSRRTDEGDGAHLDQNPTQIGAQGRSSRIRLWHQSLIRLVEPTPIVDVGEVHDDRDDVGQLGPRGTQGSLHIGDDLLRLAFDVVTDQPARCGVAGNLARHEDESAGSGRRRVRAGGRWNVVAQLHGLPLSLALYHSSSP